MQLTRSSATAPKMKLPKSTISQSVPVLASILTILRAERKSALLVKSKEHVTLCQKPLETFVGLRRALGRDGIEGWDRVGQGSLRTGLSATADAAAPPSSLKSNFTN